MARKRGHIAWQGNTVTLHGKETLSHCMARKRCHIAWQGSTVTLGNTVTHCMASKYCHNVQWYLYTAWQGNSVTVSHSLHFTRQKKKKKNAYRCGLEITFYFQSTISNGLKDQDDKTILTLQM